MALSQFLTCFVIGAASKAIVLQPRVVEAAIFKDGLCYLVREVDLKPGRNQYRLENLPDAYDGTFWYSAGSGAAVSSLQTKIELKKEAKSVQPKTRAEFITANLGKTVKLSLKDKSVVKGKVLAFTDPDNPTVTIAADNGTTSFVSLGEIAGIDAPAGGGLKVQVPSYSVGIEFEASCKVASMVRFVTLEEGAAWTSSYLLKIDGENSVLEGKAQLAMGGLTLKNALVQVLSGTPDLNTGSRYDLAVGFGSIAAYLNNGQSSFAQYRSTPRDPFALIPLYSPTRNRSAPRQNYPNGLFRGGSNAASLQAGTLDNISYARSADPGIMPDDPEPYEGRLRRDSGAARVESIYAYNFGRITMNRGDRLTKTLFRQSTKATPIVRWEAEWAQPDVITSAIRIQNNERTPWTTGSVFIVKSGVPLAQVEMPFTVPSKSADLVLGKVQDILVQRSERETSREVFKDPRNPTLPLSNLDSEFRFSIESGRDEATQVELTTKIPGEILDAGGATWERLALLHSQYNRFNEVRWLVTLKPREKQELVVKARRID